MFLSASLCRCWCPDRTIAQARKYIADSMGRRYADAVLLDLKAMWAESGPHTPLICLLSMGSDPTHQIEDLGKRLNVEVQTISMGQGQEIHARRLMSQFMHTVSLQQVYIPLPSCCVYTPLSWTPRMLDLPKKLSS